MRIKTKILRDLKRDQIVKKYSDKGRYIPQNIYTELKNKDHCDHCHKYTRQRLEIHHKIPVHKGGKSNKENLIAVCEKCHELLDG